MKGARHWFNHHSGLWPYASCGFEIDDELGDDYTLWMSRVSCQRCQRAVQAELEALAPVLVLPPAAFSVLPDGFITNTGPLPSLERTAVLTPGFVTTTKPALSRAP